MLSVFYLEVFPYFSTSDVNFHYSVILYFRINFCDKVMSCFSINFHIFVNSKFCTLVLCFDDLSSGQLPTKLKQVA